MCTADLLGHKDACRRLEERLGILGSHQGTSEPDLLAGSGPDSVRGFLRAGIVFRLVAVGKGVVRAVMGDGRQLARRGIVDPKLGLGTRREMLRRALCDRWLVRY